MTKIGRFRKLLNEAVEIAKTYGFDITLEQVIERWSEPYRFWHVLTHLYEMLEGIKDLYKEKKINDREYNILIVAAIFHDIVHDTKRKDNEEKSVEFMLSKYKPELVDIKVNISQWRVDEDIKKITEVIMCTKNHESTEGLIKKFNKLDTAILDAQFIDMLDWENKIYKEYKWVGWKTYKKKRIEFLLSQIKGHTHNVLNIKNLIDYLNKKVQKTGVCYYEIDKLPSIEEFNEKNNRVENLFDDVIILIVYNRDNYNKEKIKEYGICSNGNNEFFALMEDSVLGFINKQSGDVTIVKELKYMDKYNKSLDHQLSTKLGDFRVIYI
jgi:predicted metal-dependent HD superfamily phosphohydrolase